MITKAKPLTGYQGETRRAKCRLNARRESRLTYAPSVTAVAGLRRCVARNALRERPCCCCYCCCSRQPAGRWVAVNDRLAGRWWSRWCSRAWELLESSSFSDVQAGGLVAGLARYRPQCERVLQEDTRCGGAPETMRFYPHGSRSLQLWRRGRYRCSWYRKCNCSLARVCSRLVTLVKEGRRRPRSAVDAETERDFVTSWAGKTTLVRSPEPVSKLQKGAARGWRVR